MEQKQNNCKIISEMIYKIQNLKFMELLVIKYINMKLCIKKQVNDFKPGIVIINYFIIGIISAKIQLAI